QTNCSACHAADLSGREGPQLAGSTFISQWGDRTAGELISLIRATMPPGAGGTLPDQTYVNLAAFILDANSSRPGSQALNTSSAVSIRSVATGRRAAYLQNGAPSAPAATETKQEPTTPQPPRGITFEGEVKNYVPVTDAMLRNPDPSD